MMDRQPQVQTSYVPKVAFLKRIKPFFIFIANFPSKIQTIFEKIELEKIKIGLKKSGFLPAFELAAMAMAVAAP